jgi:hypothetical protein
MKMSRVHRTIGIGVATAAWLCATFAAGAAEAASATGNCVTTATKYRVADTSAGTTSTSFVNVLQSGLTFVQGGSAPGCVIVSFTAVITTADAWMYVKPTLDGENPVDPNSGVWRVTVQDSRTAVFVFTNVSPGSHSLVMKFRSNNGGNVTVYNRTATLSYRK